MINRSIFNRL